MTREQRKEIEALTGILSLGCRWDGTTHLSIHFLQLILSADTLQTSRFVSEVILNALEFAVKSNPHGILVVSK